MKKSNQIYLDDLLVSAKKIQEYTQDLYAAHELAQNEMILDAVLRRVQIMGEAVKRLSQEYKDNHPDLPWRQIAGLRDVVVHDYDEIIVDQLWEVVKNRIPNLVKEIEKIVA